MNKTHTPLYRYTGQYTQQPMVIQHFHYDDLTIKETSDFKRYPLSKHLIQVTGLNDPQKLLQLKQDYTVDDTVIEDILNVRQRNKIEVKENFLFAVFHYDYMVEDTIHHDYMSLVLFEDTLITFHEQETPIALKLKEALHQKRGTREKSIDYLFYLLLDQLTDDHLLLFKDCEALTTRFEEDILENQVLNQEAFYLVRKRILRLKSNIEPIHEDFDKALHHAPHLLRVEHQLAYEDVKDHLIRLISHVTESREIMRHLLDLQINNQSQKMNRIMMTLTLFSAIFIPLSFLTGFFGMNFVYFELLEYEYGLIGFVIGCIVLALGMLYMFKKMKWFD